MKGSVIDAIILLICFSPAVGLSCSSYSTCSKCMAATDCGWCASSRSCVAGNATAPLKGACAQYLFNYTAGCPCLDEQSSCYKCLDIKVDPLICGWCSTECIPGTEAGPAFACADWKSVSGDCDDSGSDWIIYLFLVLVIGGISVIGYCFYQKERKKRLLHFGKSKIAAEEMVDKGSDVEAPAESS